MDYYIDFDNTLYETTALSRDMLCAVANEVCAHCMLSYELVDLEVRKIFNRENIYNIYKLVEYLSNKYNVDSIALTNSVENIILEGKKYVYDDVENFLKYLKENGNSINLFSYAESDDLDYQLTKIKGSQLSKYFDNIIITTSKQKNDLGINYADGVFVDDNPQVLIGLLQKKPLKLIRVRRKGNKYSKDEINLEGLIEVENLIDLKGIMI